MPYLEVVDFCVKLDTITINQTSKKISFNLNLGKLNFLISNTHDLVLIILLLI
jgi:hypothetical protein